MNLTSKQKEGLLVFFSLLLFLGSSVGLYYGLFQPIQTTKEQVAQEVVMEREKLFALKKQEADLASERQFYEQKSLLQLPITQLLEMMDFQLRRSETRSGVTIKNITYSEIDTSENFPIEELNVVNAELQIETATYSQLTTFLQEIEQMERLVAIENLNFEAATEFSSDMPLSLTLTLHAFYRPDLEVLLPLNPQLQGMPGGGKTFPIYPVSEDEK